jgi:hypothetical protein
MTGVRPARCRRMRSSPDETGGAPKVRQCDFLARGKDVKNSDELEEESDKRE